MHYQVVVAVRSVGITRGYILGSLTRASAVSEVIHQESLGHTCTLWRIGPDGSSIEYETPSNKD